MPPPGIEAAIGRTPGDAHLPAGNQLPMWSVGLHSQLEGRGPPGSTSHHVGQGALMKLLVSGYDYPNAPAILVPGVGHTSQNAKGDRLKSSRTTDRGVPTTARGLVARDFRELKRVYPDIPRPQLRALLQVLKATYPEIRTPPPRPVRR